MLIWALTLSFIFSWTSDSEQWTPPPPVNWDYKLKYVGIRGDFDVYSSPGKPIGQGCKLYNILHINLSK